MKYIQKIHKLIGSELDCFDELVKKVLENDNVLLNEVIDFIFNKNGKKIRPVLVFLAAKAFGEINDKTISIAVALELLHTASLLHDDVVDESFERRFQPSVNAAFDNKVAILTGDYLLASSLDLASQTDNFQIIRFFSSLGKDLSKGEIYQLFASKKYMVDEKVYFDVIRQKTAALFAVCASSGALSVDASSNMVDLMYSIGEDLGIIFQLKDDIFDYYTDDALGKPTGNDIREGKITLPLIHAIRTNYCPEYEELIKNIQDNNFTDADIVEVVNYAKNNGGIEYAEQVMLKYKSEVSEKISQLDNIQVKEAFLVLLDYFMLREN